MVGLTGKVARHESIPAMLMPSREGSEVIGCKEHKKKAAEIIDKSITLVKDTKNIIIESAVFSASAVRKTSKKILRSEASNRFEKGLDPNRTYMAIERACTLLEKYASGEVLSDTVVYDKTNKESKTIEITIFMNCQIIIPSDIIVD